MATRQPYQLMPPLSAEEYAALRDDITENGVLVPVATDQYGNILDGHHRKSIADELGVKYRVDVVQVRDEEEARSLARKYNLARRHLSRAQKRQLIADEITASPDRTDRAIGRDLGCDHKTVGSVRRELSGEVPHPDRDLTREEAEQSTDKIRDGIENIAQMVAELLVKGASRQTVIRALEKLEQEAFDKAPETFSDPEIRKATRDLLIAPFIKELTAASDGAQ